MICAYSSYLYYIEWIIHWYQKFTLRSFTMSLLSKNYWIVEVTYMLIKYNKMRLFPWNTDRSGKNKQNTNHHPLCKKWDRKGLLISFFSFKISDRVTPFFKITPYFTNPSVFMGKIWKTTFWENFKISTPPFPNI